MKKTTTLSLLTLALAVAASAQTPDTAGLPNASVVKPGLVAAGRPAPETVAGLKSRGFRTVIDLRTPSEPGFAEERAAVEAQGRATSTCRSRQRVQRPGRRRREGRARPGDGRPGAAALRQLQPRRRRLGGAPGARGPARRGRDEGRRARRTDEPRARRCRPTRRVRSPARPALARRVGDGADLADSGSPCTRCAPALPSPRRMDSCAGRRLFNVLYEGPP